MGERWFRRFCMVGVYFYNWHIHFENGIPALLYRGISNNHGKLTPELHSRREPMLTNSIELIFFFSENNSLAAGAWKITGEDADTSIFHISRKTNIDYRAEYTQ